jgi:D-alanyl-D-alanine carboxypeptidase
MFRVSTGTALGLRCGAVALAGALVLSFSVASADARSKRKYFKRSSTAATSTYDPRYADIVVDANTGDVLHSTHADAQRHPASLTKIMTLYLLFERLETGRVRLDSQMEVSAHAASQAPTKLGVRPGQTLMVEDAIKALVTKSANDAAVVIAEYLGGSEQEFARLMTRKARALRMSRTVYRNASGLPDSAQVTTARDQALLGLAIQDRFPRYYRYFATQSFAYRGVRMANHNRLLGKVEGVDGIKTGYTRMSGFNLVSSVKRGERRIVAVVLGGTSAGARDARMRGLIEQKVSLASLRRTAPRIVEVADAAAPQPQTPPQPRAEKPIRVTVATVTAPVKAAAPVQKADAPAVEMRPAGPMIEMPAAGSTEPIKPLLVKTFSVKAGATKVVTAMSLLSPEPIAARSALASAAMIPAPRPEPDVRPEPETLPPAPPGARPGVLGVLPAREVAQPSPQRTVTASIGALAPAAPAAMNAPAPAVKEAAKPAPPGSATPPARDATRPAAPAAMPVAERKPRGSGWIIQVGAFEDRDEAREKLAAAKNKASALLKGAEPYTEVFAKGEKRYFRARFAGLKESAAEQVCKELQKSKIACFATRN